jgi:Rrf2 family protein
MSRVINISEAVSIGIHSLAVIAGSEGMINGILISDITGFSRNHTSKVLQILVKHRLLKSERGPKGGFLLNGPATGIKLIDVYRLIEGELPITNKCMHDRLVCPFKECVFGGITEKLTKEFSDYLNEKTIGDLIINKIEK